MMYLTDKIKSRINLSDKVHLNIIENGVTKINYLSFFFFDELNERNASCAALLSRVLLRGSSDYPTALELSRALDDCYGANLDSGTFKLGDRLTFSFTARSLTDRYSLDGASITDKLIDISSGVLFRPYFENGAFEKGRTDSERANAIDAIAAQINNKRVYASRRANEIMFEGDSYAASELGTEELISKISPEELTAYYHSLMKTAAVEIFFAGSTDEKSLTEQLKGLFSGLSREAVMPSSKPLCSNVKALHEVTEKMDVKQGNLVLGFRTGITRKSPEHYAYTVYNSILGGSITGKLFTVVREQMSLCYSISSALNFEKGTLSVHAGINPADFEKTVAEVKNQMAEIGHSNITEKELGDSKRDLLNRLAGLKDNPGSLVLWYLPRVIDAEGEIESPEQIAREIEAVTVESVAALSGRATLDTVYFLTSQND